MTKFLFGFAAGVVFAVGVLLYYAPAVRQACPGFVGGSELGHKTRNYF